ncbi:NDP-hexose 2,3-dehydratase family protein [Streptomyces javensis]|uniref:NDP-hexose 2,3-dehydratase family protein n=1 Tax=Streptomyces javensis TaxID=114698 RepID=UPI0033FFB030
MRHGGLGISESRRYGPSRANHPAIPLLWGPGTGKHPRSSYGPAHRNRSFGIPSPMRYAARDARGKHITPARCRPHIRCGPVFLTETSVDSMIQQVELVPCVTLRGRGLGKRAIRGMRAGGSFSVHGPRVRSGFGPVSVWSQPVISRGGPGSSASRCGTSAGVPRPLMQARGPPASSTGVEPGSTVRCTRTPHFHLTPVVVPVGSAPTRRRVVGVARRTLSSPRQPGRASAP